MKKMTLQKYIESLPEKRQITLAINLIKLALPIWENYACKNDLSYRDSVVGLTHSVETKLLETTINSIEKYQRSNKLKRFITGKTELIKLRIQFDDPVVALQDDDWVLPDEIREIFYSVYNLIDTFLGNDQSSMYVSINQSVGVLDTSKVLTSDEIRKLINEIDVV